MNNITPDFARRAGMENTQGALITAVEPESPAQRRGLQPGDVILRVGGQEVATAADAQRELNRVPPRGTAFLIVLRTGQETFVTVTRD
jgi:serine protease Do